MALCVGTPPLARHLHPPIFAPLDSLHRLALVCFAASTPTYGREREIVAMGSEG